MAEIDNATNAFNQLVAKHDGDVLVALLELMRSSRLTPADIKDLKALKDVKLNSFSNAEFATIAPFFGLSGYGYQDFTVMEVPRVALSKSIQTELYKAGYDAMMVFGHPSAHDNEGTRNRFLAEWIVKLLAQFDGRLTDKPQATMKGTPRVSPGGRVEHEIFLLSNVVVMVFEVKFLLASGKALNDCVAQVMCEMHAASHMNNLRGLQPFRVYGILSDGLTFYFFGYEKNIFYRDVSVVLAKTALQETPPKDYLIAMGPVCNRIFGVLLAGYLSGVEAYGKKSSDRGAHGDMSKLHTGPVTASKQKGFIRPSTSLWDQALLLGNQANEKFQAAFIEYKNGRIVTGDAAVEEAIVLLTASVHQISHHTQLSSQDRDTDVQEYGKQWTGAV